MDIVSVMEDWARWLSQRDFHGWPAKTILGRCLDDMPTTKCVVCDGRGRLQGHEVGSARQFLTCEVCKGKGKVPMASTATKINPALIQNTHIHGHIPKVQFNFLAHKVDLVVQTGLKPKFKDVVFIEYSSPGSQYKKAKVLNIPQQTYSDRLMRAHRKITRALTNTW